MTGAERHKGCPVQKIQASVQNGKGWARDLVPGSVAGPNIPIMVKFTPNKKETGSSPKGKGLFPFCIEILSGQEPCAAAGNLHSERSYPCLMKLPVRPPRSVNPGKVSRNATCRQRSTTPILPMGTAAIPWKEIRSCRCESQRSSWRSCRWGRPPGRRCPPRCGRSCGTPKP